MREAGLNPNLVYGNGVDGNQSGAPNVGIAGRGSSADFGFAESVNNVFRRRQLENETGIAEASQQKLLADSILSAARYLDVMQDVARKDATFDTYVETAKANLEKLQKQAGLIDAQINKTTQETNNLQIVANNLVQQGEMLAARTNLTKEQALTEVVRRQSLHAGIRLSDAQCAKIAAEIPYINAGKALRDLQYDIQDLGFQSSDELNKWLEEHPNVELGADIVDWILSRVGFTNPRAKATKKRGGKKRN